MFIKDGIKYFTTMISLFKLKGTIRAHTRHFEKVFETILLMHGFSMSVLIWIQAVCKGYQQMTLVGKLEVKLHAASY